MVADGYESDVVHLSTLQLCQITLMFSTLTGSEGTICWNSSHHVGVCSTDWTPGDCGCVIVAVQVSCALSNCAGSYWQKNNNISTAMQDIDFKAAMISMNAWLQIIFIIQVSTSENIWYTIRKMSTHWLRSYEVDVAQNTRSLCPFFKNKICPWFFKIASKTLFVA